MKKIWNGIVGFVFGVALLCSVPAVSASAAEYTVTPAEAVLYTNENTIILADADDGTVVLSEVAADLPIQVTGVTSNGYFQICLDGQIFYIHGIGLSAQDTADTVTDQVYETIMAQSSRRECTGQTIIIMAGKVEPT